MIKIFYLLTLLFALTVSPVYAERVDGEGNSLEAKYNNILVSKVIDVDALELESGEKVKLIGLFSLKDRKGIDFVRGLVEGKKIRLDFDVEKRDREGNLQAYVYPSDSPDSMLNALIIEQGYAGNSLEYRKEYFNLFHKLFREAREQGRGYWKQFWGDFSPVKKVCEDIFSALRNRDLKKVKALSTEQGYKFLLDQVQERESLGEEEKFQRIADIWFKGEGIIWGYETRTKVMGEYGFGTEKGSAIFFIKVGEEWKFDEFGYGV